MELNVSSQSCLEVLPTSLSAQGREMLNDSVNKELKTYRRTAPEIGASATWNDAPGAPG